MLNIQDLLSDVMQRSAPPVTPATVLAAIPGWDSVMMVRLMLTLEERIGRELTDVELEGMTTVGHVEKLAGGV